MTPSGIWVSPNKVHEHHTELPVWSVETIHPLLWLNLDTSGGAAAEAILNMLGELTMHVCDQNSYKMWKELLHTQVCYIHVPFILNRCVLCCKQLCLSANMYYCATCSQFYYTLSESSTRTPKCTHTAHSVLKQWHTDPTSILSWIWEILVSYNNRAPLKSHSCQPGVEMRNTP